MGPTRLWFIDHSVLKTRLPSVSLKIVWTYFCLESLTQSSFISALPHASKGIRDRVFSYSLDEGK